ncbi:MAG: right-handed parallel beta-helix repeat-containing protein [Planctomycetota bacterium]
MNREPFPARIALSLAALVVVGGILSAGPLNPPPGAVTSTYKTLTEVEPRIAVNAANTPGDNDATPSLFKISQPGSYYLTANITGLAGKHGIEIAASGVTLDLNGFDLIGVGGSLDGIAMSVVNLHTVAVVNGSIRAWQGDGLDFSSTGGLSCRLADLRVQGNTGNGLSVGIGSAVTDCVAFSNANNGISTGTGSTITHCSAWGNANAGINMGLGCTITGCNTYSNTLAGINTAGGATITGCTVRGGNMGISAGHGSTVTACTATLTNGNGISVGDGCTVTGCTAASNAGHGIYTGGSSGSTIDHCTANSNSGIGINVFQGCSVIDCTVRSNTLDGIRCVTDCIIRGNACFLNGLNAGDGAGIHATLGNNRIEGNNCTETDRGIDIDSAGNVIVRNVCSNNTTNWSIVAGNSVAPIVITTTNAAAINGNSYAGNLGTADPHANLTH